jgi:c-di-GMP-binding flagellar brake protein YcgR
MPESNQPPERRLHPRSALKIPVKYRVIEARDGNRNEKTSHAMDIAVGGLFLLSNHTLEKHSLIRIDITLPKMPQMISAYARVIWANHTGGGLQFEAMKSEDEEALKKYLSRIPAENLNK